MTVRFSDNWLGRTAGAVVDGTSFNNALGGSGTTTIERTSATHYVVAAATGGFLSPGNATASFIGGVAGSAGVFDGKIRMLVDISAGRSPVRLKGAGTTAIAGIQVTLNATHTSLQISTGTSTPSQTVAAPTGNFWVELEIVDLSCTARLLNAGDLAVLASFTTALPSTRARGGYWSALYGAATVPINTLLGSVIMDDLATGAAAPTINSVTAAKSGKYGATGSINSTGADGKVFYKWYAAAATPTASDVMSTGTAADWTAAGAFPVITAGLAAGQSYKLAAVRRDSGFNVSAVAVSSTFTTDPPLAAPTGTTSRTVSGQTVRVIYTPGVQPVETVSVSIPPAAVNPGGAVTQGPMSAVFDGSLNIWVAEFTTVAAGVYDEPVTLASNSDNPSVSITGATGFAVVGMDGQPVAPDAEQPANTVQVPFLLSAESLWAPTVASPGGTAVAPPFLASAEQIWIPVVSGFSGGAQVIVPSFDCIVEFGAVAVSSTAASGVDVPFLQSGEEIWAPSLSLPASGLEVEFLDSAELLWDPTVEGLVGGFEGSLITMEQADKYVLEFYGADHAWFSVAASRKRIALRRATQYLLANYCIKPIYLDPLHKNVIAAAAEAAIRALSGALFEDQNAQHVESVTVGPISRKMSAPRAGGQKRFTVIDQLLRGLTCNSPGMVRFERA